MSENLDLVRLIYGSWEGSDYSDLSWADPDIEYVMADGPDPGTWRGVEGMTEAFRNMLKAWVDWRVTAEGYVELDGERILVPYHFTARGRSSGVEVGKLETRGATLFHVHAGRVTRIVQYFDPDHAFSEFDLGG